MGFLRSFVGFDGRIGRLTYFLCSLLLLVFVIAFAAVFFGTYGMDYGKTPEETRIWTFWSLALDLLLLYPTLAITTKRLHDLNLSGWWNLAFWLPSFASYTATLAGLAGTSETPTRLGDVLGWIELGTGIMWLALCLIPGARAANRFGPSPLETPPMPAPGATAA
jgi:uncharacterized membrane protein YhaH (DUF805 family)